MLKIYIAIASVGAGMALSAAIIADHPGAAQWLAVIGLAIAVLCLGGMLSEMRNPNLRGKL